MANSLIQIIANGSSLGGTGPQVAAAVQTAIANALGTSIAPSVHRHLYEQIDDPPPIPATAADLGETIDYLLLYENRLI